MALMKSIRKRLRRLRSVPAVPADPDSLTVHPESILLLTLDSLRVDIFQQAHCPNLKALGHWFAAQAPATFTYASHLSIFVGVTPTVPESDRPFVNPKAGRIFRIINSAAGGVSTDYLQMKGRNIVEGFNRLGYRTIGTGAMRWFDPSLESSRVLTDDFQVYRFTHTDVEAQVGFVLSELAKAPAEKHFVFVNVGETHIPYHYKGAPWTAENFCVPLGANNNREICQERQRLCLEFVDEQLKPLLDAFSRAGCTMVICSDHGDCHGEDGLWGHGFVHEQVMQVPMMMRLRPHDRHREHINTANEGIGVDISRVRVEPIGESVRG